MLSKLKALVKLLLYKDSWMLHTQIWRYLKRKEVVDTQSRNVTDKIVASVFTNNKNMFMVYIMNILLLGIVW